MEIADFFLVNPHTIHEWKKFHPSFSESLRAGKTKAEADVVSKLLDRALGAEWIVEQAFKLINVEYDNGRKVLETETVKVVEVHRATPPDTPALSLWLRNRQPKYRHDKPEPSPDDVTLHPVKVQVEVIDARKPNAAP